MDVLTIPELLRKILKRCSTSTDQICLIKTCKLIYESLDSKYKLELVKVVELDHHSSLGCLMCTTECTISSMVLLMTQLVGYQDPMVQKLIKMYFLHEQIRHLLYVIAVGSGDVYNFYHGNHQKQGDSLYLLLSLDVPRLSYLRHLGSVLEELKVWDLFIERMKLIFSKVDHLRHRETYRKHTTFSDEKVEEEIGIVELYSKYFVEWCYVVKEYRSMFEVD